MGKCKISCEIVAKNQTSTMKFLTIPAIPIILSNFILLDMRNLQEKVKKAFWLCYQKLFWTFPVSINCSSNCRFWDNIVYERSLIHILAVRGQQQSIIFQRSPLMLSMAIRVVEFSNGGYKIRKIFA